MKFKFILVALTLSVSLISVINIVSLWVISSSIQEESHRVIMQSFYELKSKLNEIKKEDKEEESGFSYLFGDWNIIAGPTKGVVITIRPDGSTSASNNGVGAWNKKGEKFVITWNGGFEDTIVISDVPVTQTSFINNKGSVFIIKKSSYHTGKNPVF